MFNTSVLGDFAILADMMPADEKNSLLDFLWLIILLAIINAIELVSIGILLKRNANDKKKAKNTKMYSFIGMPILLATIMVPEWQTTTIAILGVSAVILACIIVYLALKRYKIKQTEMRQADAQEIVATTNYGESNNKQVASEIIDNNLNVIIASAHQ